MIFVYEIFLGEFLVANSGEFKFHTEQEAEENAIKYLDNLLKTDSKYNNCIVDDFDINVSEISKDDFLKGW